MITALMSRLPDIGFFGCVIITIIVLFIADWYADTKYNKSFFE